MTMLNVTANTVPARLRAARLLAGMDQAQIAQQLGVSRYTVGNWERGVFEPTVTQFLAWAQITGQPADQMIDGLSECAPRDLNPEPTDSEVDRQFWRLVDAAVSAR